MKIFKLFSVFVLIFGMMSCATMNQSMSQASSNTTNSAAYTAGSACGGALLALYTQYKTDGKIDLSNPTNLIHLATLAGSSANLKANLKDNDYYQGFANGTVFGSKETISTSSVTNVLNSLSGIDFSSINKKAEAATQTTETISSVVSLLSLLKQ